MTSLQKFKKILKHPLSYFIFPFIFLAAPLPAGLALEIPAEHGQVYENFTGTNGKTLVLIQEAHVDYGAQKAISEILKSLVRGQSPFEGTVPSGGDRLRLILVEGGWGDIGLSYLRNYGSPEGRKEVAERYLKEGKISGEEYLDLTSDLDFQLWGIEDPKLYEENMKAFLKIQPEEERLFSEMDRLESLLDSLKEKLFPASLRELEKKKRALDEKKISLIDYLRFLGDGSQGDRPGGVPARTVPPLVPPLLKKVLSVSGMGGSVDPEKAEWEKQNLIQALSKKLTKPELDKIQLLQDRKSPAEELALLKSLLEFHKKHAQKLKSVKIKNLTAYTQALEEVSRVDARKIFSELETLEEKFRQSQLVTPGQKRLGQISQAASILRKLFELKLTPGEFQKLEKNPEDFKATYWKNFLEDNLKPVPLGTVPDLKRIQEFIPFAKSFYLSAEKREKALIENAVRKFEEEGDPIAALIVGGFHAENLVEALKNKGYSLVLVAPRFTPGDAKTQGRRYFEILKYKWGNGPAPQPGPVPPRTVPRGTVPRRTVPFLQDQPGTPSNASWRKS